MIKTLSPLLFLLLTLATSLPEADRVNAPPVKIKLLRVCTSPSCFQGS